MLDCGKFRPVSGPGTGKNHEAVLPLSPGLEGLDENFSLHLLIFFIIFIDLKKLFFYI